MRRTRHRFTSLQQVVIGLVTGSPGRLGPPVPRIAPLPPSVQQQVDGFLACSFVGSPGTVHAGLADFIAATGVDELVVRRAIHDHAARVVRLTTRAAWDHASS
jgi:alkanesulfonate monooxygenase SsuD/methylene tetrahydromethanopterin reductase-like flavin-dependent oxidoreductase (luciferase family)